MSRFDQRLKTARQRQRYTFAAIGGILAIGALVVAGVAIFGSATAVRLAPADAAQSGTVRVAEGAAFTVSGVVYALSASPVIAAEAPGFRLARRRIESHERGGTITVTLQELPGRLLAATTPANDAVRWSLDGESAATAGRFERELPAGAYRIEAAHPYYQPAERQVALGRGETVELDVPLQAVEGELSIQSVPAGASVTIDGEPAGVTPLRRSVAGGKYQVEVSHERYAAVSEQVEITNAAASVERHYRLARPAATLAFDVHPRDGALLVDGKNVSPTRSHSVPAETPVTVSYLRDGYAGVTRSVTARAGETTRVRLHLEPEFGRVDIRSRPVARVFIDGTERGSTPLRVRLPTAAHTIALRRPGYRTVERRVTPSSARTQVIDETLLTESAARRAEAPRQYTNAAGVELVLFHPTPFRMGAARHEKGQRANESERQVALRKPFYAGKYEITNAQFRRFDPGHSGADDLPVTEVGWLDAARFCNWLSREDGSAPFYDVAGGALRGVHRTSDGYRLLTEAEWEWLARRAGRRTGTVFPWGDEFRLSGKVGNVADETARGTTQFFIPHYVDGYAGVAPVGKFPAEASGLHDLTGNVSEWVHDYYTVVPNGRPESDPLGPASGSLHVIKGSSWRSGSLAPLRAAYRDGLRSGRDDVGFRIARYLEADDATLVQK